MSTLSTLLQHVYLFHAAAPCQLFPPSCTLSTFPHCFNCHVYFYNACTMSPCCVYLFHIAMLCLLFPRCCDMSLLSHVAPCLHFPHGCAMSTISTLLLHVSFSMLLRHVYFFIPSCTLSTFPFCCVMSTF